MAKKIMKLGAYRTLVAQLDKLARHNRQGSFQTKTRYYEAFKRFCSFLADEFHLQKLTNISGKHLVSYVLYLQDNDLAPAPRPIHRWWAARTWNRSSYHGRNGWPPDRS